MKIFYALFPPEDCVAARCLDAARALLRPETTSRAHVTVRGPYAQPQPDAPWLDAARGAVVSARGVDTFWSPTQHTVFLRVQAPGLRGLWHKPDYPDGVPHLTVYDGPSRAVAERLVEMLEAHRPEVAFVAGRLEPIFKHPGRPALTEALNTTLVSLILGREIDLGAAAGWPQDARLALAERILAAMRELDAL